MLPVALFALGTAAASADEFVVDGLRYSTLDDNTVTVKKYVEGTDIVIPAKVTDPETSTEYSVVQVERQAFYNTTDVKTVSIPSSVKKIDTYAFWKCGAETVTIAEGLEGIGHAAFKECKNLKNINLPSTLTELGYMWDVTGNDGSVFVGCTALESIDIPGSVEHLPQLTFSECTNLKNVTLHEGTVSIGEHAFGSCSALQGVEMPMSVESWDRGIFDKSGVVSPVIPGRIKIIPNSAFWYCKNMTSFTIEEGIEEVGKSSFADVGPITEIKVPNSVEWVRSDAFQGNGAVKKVYLGSGVRRMGHACLAVWVPDQATNTPQWVLEEIHITSPVPPVHEQNDEHFEQVADDFFFGGKEFTDELRTQFYSEVKLYVPADAVDAYKAADIWREFVNVLPESKQDGIEGIAAEGDLNIECGIARAAGAIEVYTVSGVRVAAAQAEFDLNTLGKGLYIVKSGNKSLKTVVK